MRRLERGTTLVLATHNAGKAVEINDLLAPHGLRVISAGELGLPEPEETGETFAANALLKAHAAAQASGKPALADDSGLSVAALGGQPGIYSARWAGPSKDFGAAMRRVEAELDGNPNRAAAFICVLALAWPDGHSETFAGRTEGTLAWPPRGGQGFGYDPVFVPDGGDGRTFGEMDMAEKKKFSHRAKAFALFTAGCTSA